LAVLIGEGATVEDNRVAEELTIGGMVKGTIHANRVRLNSTAAVEGDIFHQSLSIQEMRALKDHQNVRTMLAKYCASLLQRPMAHGDVCSSTRLDMGDCLYKSPPR
jgi:cytoskeletal protein CcmA (bactofilin family)